MTELNFFGQEAKFHHIGVAVKSIKDTGLTAKVISDPIQKVRVAVALLHGVKLEFIEPDGHDSPINASLKKGTKLVHICYAVTDIEKALEKCRKHGFLCVARPVPSAAFNSNIAWVYSSEYGLFELLEEER